MKTKIASFIAFLFFVGFLFVMILPSQYSIHLPGEPVRDDDVFKESGQGKTENVRTMDDYFLRNGQQETGSNNIVTSVVFDYRGFDTLGEGTVLFIAVSSISMLLYQFLKKKKESVVGPSGFSPEVSRIVSYAAFLLFPIIVIFGAYLVIHGHLSPGGGFQGGAVTASGTALLLVGMLITRKSYTTRKILGIFESLALVAFIGIGFAGLTTAFLYNFMATPDSFMNIMPFGPNNGDLTSAGTLPFISLAVGVEVFCGISIILVALYNMTKADKEEEKEVKEES
jgi:multicomponent Na+:H+ antiporter subunit B